MASYGLVQDENEKISLHLIGASYVVKYTHYNVFTVIQIILNRCLKKLLMCHWIFFRHWSSIQNWSVLLKTCHVNDEDNVLHSRPPDHYQYPGDIAWTIISLWHISSIYYSHGYIKAVSISILYFVLSVVRIFYDNHSSTLVDKSLC